MKENFPDMDFDKNPVEIICMECANKRIALQALAGKDIEVRPPTPEQMKEIRAHRNKNNPNVN